MPGKCRGPASKSTRTATRSKRTGSNRKPKGSANNKEISPRKQMSNILGQERLRRAIFELGGLTKHEKARILHSETGVQAVKRARKANIRRGIKFKKDQ